MYERNYSQPDVGIQCKYVGVQSKCVWMNVCMHACLLVCAYFCKYVSTLFGEYGDDTK